MDFSLHNHPIIPLTVPLAGDEGHIVRSWTLGPMLQVVGTDGGRAPLGRAQHVEEPKQVH
jgi:hypothetical protein